jgi:hypothetical protein
VSPDQIRDEFHWERVGSGVVWRCLNCGSHDVFNNEVPTGPHRPDKCTVAAQAWRDLIETRLDWIDAVLRIIAAELNRGVHRVTLPDDVD